MKMIVTAIVGGFGILIGTLFAIDAKSSDSSFIGICLLLSMAYAAFLFVMLILGKGRRLLVRSACCGLLALITYEVLVRVQCPANIRFEFSNPGNTGTYQKVQFYHKISGQWIKGPSVEGWPLTVSFPDINHDGHPDIRVVESLAPKKGAIEFIYIPESKDGIYWKAGRMDSGLSAGYTPGKIFHNYP
jgi:hypothetical protein